MSSAARILYSSSLRPAARPRPIITRAPRSVSQRSAPTKRSSHQSHYSHTHAVAASWYQVVAGAAVIGAWAVYEKFYTASQPDEDEVQLNSIKRVALDDPLQLQKEARNPIVSRDSTSPRRVTLSRPNSAEITGLLRENEASYNVGRGNGVQSFYTCQIPSNTPIEDAHSEKMLKAPHIHQSTDTPDWMFWGIYDGHRGWPTSAKLKQSLIGYVFAELRTLYQNNAKHVSEEMIDTAIVRSFLALDKEIVYDSIQQVMKAKSKSLAAQILSPALSGSCALLAFYDSATGSLKTACTGDSRAVLGRKTENGLFKAIPLSIDQTGGSPSEAARIRAEHPDEEKAVARGRVLGTLEPSRSFGDGIYKWTVESQLKLHKSFFARSPNPNSKTPPYVTAEPVITTTTIQPETEDFVVMASDALWEMLTNEEVVGLVAQWKLHHHGPKPRTSSLQSLWSAIWPASPKALPVEPASGPVNTWRVADRPEQWELQRDPSQYVYKDGNVATHIARNAFGGNQEDLVAGLLMLPTPNSRRYRDDLTITVIFFGEDEKAKHESI